MFYILIDKNNTKSLHDYVLEKLSLKDCSDDVTECINTTLKIFKTNFYQRWKQCNRIKERFLSKHSDWIDKDLKFPEKVYLSMKTHSIDQNPSTSDFGRPKKIFSESGERTKRRIVKPLIEEHPVDELAFATQFSLRASGKRDAAEIMKEVTQTTPTRATKFKKAFKSPALAPIPYSAEEALSLLIENNLTKKHYNNIREGAKYRNSNIYPSYKVVLEAKLACYPPKETIRITETSADIKLQSLVDHTIMRIVSVQQEVLKQTVSEEDTINIIFKWGCDGSSGQSLYKQKFKNDGSDETCYSDSDLFVVSIVPLQMYSTRNGNLDNKIILWQNNRPSSTRFCRPIKLLFEKETKEMAKREIHLIEKQIEELAPTKVIIDKMEIQIFQKLVMTMVDGKICSAMTDISAQKCYVCGASPKEMNSIELSTRTDTNDNFDFNFGLSTLHAWIRFFECLLHIAYRIDIKIWQVRKLEDKEAFAARKKEIIRRFRLEMGLIVDQPKPGGSGTSNDGNTARRFFYHTSLSAEITGIDEELIKRFSTILRAISSNFPINTDAFNKYTLETTALYLKLYPWYYMPATVHKILIHGSKIIELAILPIGQLSEEAQEARNKDCKRFRENHSRKFSRISSITDVLNMLLVSSDPIISQISPLVPKKKRESFPKEVLQLLKEPHLPSKKYFEGDKEEEFLVSLDDDISDSTDE